MKFVKIDKYPEVGKLPQIKDDFSVVYLYTLYMRTAL